MRAPFILAAVLAVGAQAAVLPREATTTTTATTDVTEIVESVTSTVAAEITSTPTETATETVTESADAEHNEVVGLWGSLMADCSNSTVPRSDVCVSQMWHTTGCVAHVPADKLSGWANVEDAAALKAEMQGFYANATAADATQEAKDTCVPVPKAIMVGVNCVHNVTTDMCKDCFSSSNFLGFQLPKINATCVDSCLRDPENANALTEVCPSAANLVNCKDTLNSTCGQCVTQKPGNLFGLPILSVDEDCFKDCYSEKNSTIREACPLPAPMKKAFDCHKTLADQCSECVGDDHEIDEQCIDGCIQDKILSNPALNETCPPAVLSGFMTITQVIPTEEDIETIFNTLLSQIQIPSFDLNGLLGGLFGNINGSVGAADTDSEDDNTANNEFGNMIQGLFSQLQGSNANTESSSNNNSGAQVNTFITNILSQLGLGPNASEVTSTSTETAN